MTEQPREGAAGPPVPSTEGVPGPVQPGPVPQPVAYQQPVYIQQVMLPPYSGAAVTGFILSIVGITGGFMILVLPIAGLIVSIVGFRQTNGNPNRRGYGLAVAGIVMGAIGTLLVALIAVPSLMALIAGLGGAASTLWGS